MPKDARQTKQRVADLTAAGFTPRRIAHAVGITTQRVYQILKELGLEPAREKAATA